MPKTLTPVSVFPSSIPNFPLAGAGEPVAIGPLESAVQAVLNRTEHLHTSRQVVETTGVRRIQRVVSLTALQNLAGMADGDTVDVEGYGRYRLYNPSALTADGLWILTATGGGRWVHTAYLMRGASNAWAMLDSGGRLAQDVRDSSILTHHLGNGEVTGPKLSPGAAVANIGYTPANRAGESFTGNISAPEVRWGADGGRGIRLPNNADLNNVIDAGFYLVFQPVNAPAYIGEWVACIVARGDLNTMVFQLVAGIHNNRPVFRSSTTPDGITRVWTGWSEIWNSHNHGPDSTTHDARYLQQANFNFSRRFTFSTRFEPVSIDPNTATFRGMLPVFMDTGQQLILRRARCFTLQPEIRVFFHAWTAPANFIDITPNVSLVTASSPATFDLNVGLQNTHPTTTLTSSNRDTLWVELEIL